MKTHIAKTLFLLLFLALNIYVSAQKGVTFKVEDLSKPDSILPTTEVENILKDFCAGLADVGYKKLYG